MVADELTRALIEETTLEDISESYRPVVDIIGIEKFIELSEYAKGDELYFPKTENIIAPARNRRIKKEWNGQARKSLWIETCPASPCPYIPLSGTVKQ